MNLRSKFDLNPNLYSVFPPHSSYVKARPQASQPSRLSFSQGVSSQAFTKSDDQMRRNQRNNASDRDGIRIVRPKDDNGNKCRKKFIVSQLSGGLCKTCKSALRVKCKDGDTIGDLKKLLAARASTRAENIQIQKWYTIYKDHVSLKNSELMTA